MTNIPKLQIYGKQLLEDTVMNIASARREFTFEFEPTENNIIKFIRESGITFSDISFVHRTMTFSNEGNSGLKFHVDDCQIVRRTEPPVCNKELYTQLNDIDYLYFNNKFHKLPTMTFIFYLSTYGKDFYGGILRLVDGTEIIAKNGTGFMFDSREVHMVTPVKSGTRKSIVVKIY